MRSGLRARNSLLVAGSSKDGIVSRLCIACAVTRHRTMTLRRQAARGLFWTALDNWGYQLATLVVFSILARLVAPEAFGLVALATVFTMFLKVAADQGMADAIVQRPELDNEHINGAFWASVTLGGVLTAVLALASGPVAAAFDNPALAPILAALSLTLAISGLSTVQRAILTRDFAFASLTLRSLLSVVIGGIAGVVAAVLGAGVWSLVVQALTFEVVAVIALWVASDWRPRWGFSWPHVKELLPFGANIVGFRLLRLANTQSDNFMIGLFLGATALGFYVVAYRLLRLVINISTAVIGSVAFPTFARVQHDDERVRDLYYRTLRLAALVTFPSFIGLIIIAPEVTRLMFGPGWEESIAVMRVLGFAGLATALNFLNPTVLKALGKPSWRVVIMGATAVLQVIAFAIAARWDVLAVAGALAVVTFALTPAWFYAVHKLISFRITTLVGQFLTPAGASLLMIAAVLFVKGATVDVELLPKVIILVATGFVTYALGLWLLDRRLAMEAIELGRLAIPGLGPRRGETSTNGHIDDARSCLVEITGVAGAGKSTLTRALCDADSMYMRAEFIHTRAPSHLVYVIRSIPRLLTILAANLSRKPRMSWADFKLMVYVTQWRSFIQRRPEYREGITVLDQGPMYALVRLKARQRGVASSRSFQRWWDEMLTMWADTLSAVVWLDAPADVLRARINGRVQAHAVKGVSDEASQRFVAEYHGLFEEVFGRLERSGRPKLWRFDTGDHSVELLAADVRSVLVHSGLEGGADGG